jgi:hypothetical protein
MQNTKFGYKVVMCSKSQWFTKAAYLYPGDILGVAGIAADQNVSPCQVLAIWAYSIEIQNQAEVQKCNDIRRSLLLFENVVTALKLCLAS